MLPYIALALGSAIGFVVINLFLKHRPRPEAYVSSGIDLKNQTVLLPGPERIRRSPAAVDKLVSYFFEDCQTLHGAFLRGVRTSGNREFLGTRAGDGPYVWETYNQIYERVVNFGSGLISLGVAPGQQTFIGVYSQNRPEWIITEQMSNAWSTVLVPLYDTLGSDSVEYIVNQARISVIVCDPPKVKGLLPLLPHLPTLKLIIKMEQVTEEEKKVAESHGVSIQSMASVEKLGKANPRSFMPPQPNDVATVCYTSGTTGDPKGAMLTHCNLISDTASLAILVERSNVPKPVMDHNDVHISYLPLAHMFERVAHLWLVQCGARIGFFRGDVKLLMQDITALRPTVFVSVPRLLNRVYDKVMAGVDAAPSYKKTLFKLAVAAKTRELEQGIIRNNSIWDKLVFHKVQSTLGGRIKFVLTGAAPISKSCLQFLRVAFGCPVLEGYGQTECTAGACLTLFDDTQSAGSVGSLLPCGEIKLVTVPDTKYNSANDEGEVCFRGFHVMKGYLNNPEKTAEAIDSQGWLHSGDIGKWDEFGRLRIIDRKKAIFKLAQGEYIAPEKIENIYIRAKSVAQVFVYGDSLQSTLVAIIVPDHEAMPTWIKDNVPGLNPNSSLEDICRDPRVVSAVHKEILAIGQESKLASFEQVKAVHLTPHAFTVENHQLTPTFKAKRPQITEAYRAEIDRLYAKIASEQPPEKH